VVALYHRRGQSSATLAVVPGTGRQRTQFFLKQSCEQKKLSLTPSFRQVGHCNEPASFSQSAPRHFFFVGGSEVMADEGAPRLRCDILRRVYEQSASKGVPVLCAQKTQLQKVRNWRCKLKALVSRGHEVAGIKLEHDFFPLPSWERRREAGKNYD